MGGPFELVEAPIGAIADKKILNTVDEISWIEPTIEQLSEGAAP